ncbi:MAG TPA: IPT/TIG domain-containing protein, partial [Steroidobacter sp.]|nr:IPT/TIG domain-containing protein [Steroidobacter sp.]
MLAISSNAFALAPPTIATMVPSTAAAGEKITIVGSNFSATPVDNVVTFSGAAGAVVDSATPTELVVVVPNNAITGPVTVATSGGTAASSSAFTRSSWRTLAFGLSGGAQATGVAHNGTRFVAVTTNRIETSTDARRWVTTLTPGYAVTDVAWNGQMFMAVGNASRVYASTNGLTWVGYSLPSGNTRALKGIAAGAGVWVAVGDGGVIFYSADGKWWVAPPAITTKNLTDVTWAENRFVAVGAGGEFLTSANGQNWTRGTSPTTDDLVAVAGSSTHSVVASAVGTVHSLVVETNTWNLVATMAGAPASITYSAGRFVVMGDRSVGSDFVTSESGDWGSWFAGTSVLEGGPLVHANGQFLSVGRELLTSSDGFSWTGVQSYADFSRIARADNAGGRLMVAGPGSYYTYVYGASEDGGATWNMDMSSGIFRDLAYSPVHVQFLAKTAPNPNSSAGPAIDRYFRHFNGYWYKATGSAPYDGPVTASPSSVVLSAGDGKGLNGVAIATDPNVSAWYDYISPTTDLMRGAFWSGAPSVLATMARSPHQTLAFRGPFADPGRGWPPCITARAAESEHREWWSAPPVRFWFRRMAARVGTRRRRCPEKQASRRCTAPRATAPSSSWSSAA